MHSFPSVYRAVEEIWPIISTLQYRLFLRGECEAKRMHAAAATTLQVPNGGAECKSTRGCCNS